jgi:hypothetical protein
VIRRASRSPARIAPRSRLISISATWASYYRCLDFVNTELIEQGRRVDRLKDFADLVDWLEQARVLSGAQAKQVRHRWGQTSKGAGALSEAHAFRRMFRGMVEGILHGKRPSAFVLNKINALLRHRTLDVALARTRHGFERRVSWWRFRSSRLRPRCSAARIRFYLEIRL